MKTKVKFCKCCRLYLPMYKTGRWPFWIYFYDGQDVVQFKKKEDAEKFFLEAERKTDEYKADFRSGYNTVAGVLLRKENNMVGVLKHLSSTSYSLGFQEGVKAAIDRMRELENGIPYL
jgi:hypothetical protein